MIRRHAFLLFIFALVACASKSKQEDPLKLNEEELKRPKFEQGMKALDASRFQEAADIFDRLLVAKPGSELDLITLFNSAAAYEGLGNCAKSSERYREVIRSSAGKFDRIEAEAFYRLSFMYECLGQDNKAIAALLDARKRSRALPYATANAEIPARLAAGYARIGNRAKAVEYFGIASKGLKKIVTQESGKKQQAVLAQSLFFMGQLNPAQRRGEGDPMTFINGLSLQQPYLLQSIELNQSPWSQKSAEDLEAAYENIWKYKFADQEQQRKFYIRALQTANELKSIRLPKADPLTDAVFRRVEDISSKLQNDLTKVAETNRLTPEAESREGLKRQGRLVDPPQTRKSAKPAAKKKVQ
jgi:tetratricopeptide (TPR) repeat protein